MIVITGLIDRAIAKAIAPFYFKTEKEPGLIDLPLFATAPLTISVFLEHPLNLF